MPPSNPKSHKFMGFQFNLCYLTSDKYSVFNTRRSVIVLGILSLTCTHSSGLRNITCNFCYVILCFFFFHNPGELQNI